MRTNMKRMPFRNRRDHLLLWTFIFCAAVAFGQTSLCAEVRTVDGNPELWIDGEVTAPFAYMSYLGKEKNYRAFSDAGVRIFNVPAYFGDQGINSTSGIGPFRPSVWIDSAGYDLTRLKEDMDEIIAAAADAMIIIRVHLDPPRWWQEKNPDELCLLPDQSHYRVSFFSEKWRKEAGEMLRAVVMELLSDARYAPHLLGIHVAGGMTEEWFYHYKEHFYDESKARQAAFRNWLRNRYDHSVGELKKTWQREDVDFDHALPEDISGKNSSSGWRDPVKDRSYFDTFDFQAENMVQNIEYFCKIVKEASQGCLLTGAFYGYHYFVTEPQRGHGALGKLLNCPDLDYLSSPNDYKRETGEDWPPMAATGSVKLHGKLWLAENDTRTYLTTLLREEAPEIDPGGEWYTQGVWKGPESPEESHALVLKNLGRMLTGGYGGWWFDMWGGWFSDSVMMSMIAHGVEAYPASRENVADLTPEVAVVVDERLSFYDKSFGRQTGHLLQNKYALAKSGAPYELFLRTDIAIIPVTDYKVIWLMGLPDIKAEEKKILEQWSRAGLVIFHTDLGSTVRISYDVQDPQNMDQVVFDEKELYEMWHSAEVHLYSSPGSVIHAGSRWFTIHTGAEGEKTIFWPGDFVVRDLLTGERIPVENRKSVLTLEAGETRIFELSMD